jgi:hypothetical protein
MQRWIVLGVVGIFLMAGGAYMALQHHRQNRPAPVWVPMPLNSEVPEEKIKALVKDLKEKLSKPEVMLKISKDLGLSNKWNLVSDDAAAKELTKRLFVKIGETEAKDGKVPSLNVGVSGPEKDRDVSTNIAKRLMQDVWPILGIKPPPSKAF